MKSYFSQIAKQSGLRFSGQSVQPRPSSAGETAPLHLEETVLIPPPLPGKKSTGLHETLRRGLPEASQSQKRDGREQTPVSAGETSVVKHVLKDRRTVSADANNLKKPPPLTEEINDRQDPISDVFFVTDQSVFKESERSGEGNERTVRPVAAKPFEPDVSKPAESSSSPEKQPKEYFSKTAEIIEKGETSTAEIQNIIFQEVQEWAAATPDDSEMPLGNDPGHPEIVITKHFEQSKSPGVIYIRENSSRENERLAEPLEQSFDLSIGTISVVIEEAETSAHLAAPPQTNNRPPSTDAKREFSRLSRSYI